MLVFDVAKKVRGPSWTFSGFMLRDGLAMIKSKARHL